MTGCARLRLMAREFGRLPGVLLEARDNGEDVELLFEEEREMPRRRSSRARLPAACRPRGRSALDNGKALQAPPDACHGRARFVFATRPDGV